MTSVPGVTPARWRALTVWGAGLIAYIVAVAGRTSLGVAGLEAADRFDISAATLATFSVVQLAVYAAAQIPAGMLLDRIGSRALIASGALVLGLGQILLGTAETLSGALAARVLIGLGDAVTLLSVLRLVAAWFPPRTIPLFTQLTAILGQLGQVISAVPFLAVLHLAGWEAAFAALGGTGVVVALIAVVTVRNEPHPGRRRGHTRVQLGPVAANPSVWQGFFAHAITLFPANSFLFLWGLPFLTVGQGRSAAVSGALLSATVVAGFVIGPTVGVLTGRLPHRRDVIVLVMVSFSALTWASVLLPGTPRPTWQLVLLMIAVAAGMATCAIGFDFARTSVAPQSLGTATGLVNVGGYVFSLLAVLLMGVVLDAVRSSGGYTLDDFRLAFASQALLLGIGVAGFLVAGRRARADRIDA